MACELTAGYSKQACASNGGVDAIVVLNYANLASYTLDAAESEITAISTEIGTKAYKITPDLESASATQTPTRSRENNTYMVAQTVMCMLKDDEIETQDLTSILGKGFFLVIVMQSNGKNRVFGLYNGMTLDTEENVTGQVYEDMNGSTLNFVGKELIKAPTIATALVDAIQIPAS